MFANMFSSDSYANKNWEMESNIEQMNKGTESVLDAYKSGNLSSVDLDEAYSMGLVSYPVYKSLKRKLDNI